MVKEEAVIINSATTSVSMAQASAANSADEKLIRTATFPNGSNEAREASITQRGNPGGCATPGPEAARINSALSTSVTVGARGERDRDKPTTKRAPARHKRS